MDEIGNPRLRRLRTRLMAYSFIAVWFKGATNQAPDALSRHPVAEPQRTDLLAEYDEDSVMELSIAEIRTITNKEDSNIKLQELCQSFRDSLITNPSYQKSANYTGK